MATLDFKGKSLVQNYHLTVKYHELVPKKDKSLTDRVRLDDNLIIHGDNLKALKALLPTYAGKMKCIYIDPPYNTGNEGWAYNDNVNSPMMQDWLGKAVDSDDLTRHDKWLCMMTPRLKLLRELMRKEGFIFISIDDNEVHRLRALMDEIFGEENFVTTIVWQRKRGRDNSAKFFSKSHEYLVCFAKDISQAEIHKLEIGESTKEAYRNPDKDSRGDYRLLGVWARGTQGGSKFAYKSKSGKKFSERLWLVNEESMEKLDLEDRLVFVGDKVYRKLFLNEHEGSVPETIWSDASNAANAADEMKLIFGEQAFETPKPVPLVKRVLELTTTDNDFVLDSFAGSGTTAHTVLAMNKEDGGNRKFILVECEDYADKITAERVRRVIKGVRSASDVNLKKGLGGTFSYFELGKAIELDSILDGKNLPSYLELARYVFYTATGEEFDERKVNEKRQFVGESKTHEVYLFYKPDIDHLKKTALTLERAEEFGKPKANGKRRLVFAPTKYLDQEQLDALRIDFAQLPFEIYKLAR